MKPNLTRREFLEQGVGAVCSYFLLETLFTRELIARPLQPPAQHWAKELNDMCLDLRRDALTLAQWQERIETLFDRIEPGEMLRFIDFDKLTRQFEFPDLGVSAKPVAFPKLEGLPPNLAFHKKIFGVKKDRAIIPHGHKNMVSAHLVLKGEFDLRHYDKLEEEPEHLIITPTIERRAVAGTSSSISDEKNKIHWFITRSDYAFTFDLIMTELDPNFGKPYDIDNLDPHQAEKLSNNRLRVRKLGVEEARKKYGKEMHH